MSVLIKNSGFTDVTWMIGGPQGTGVDSAANLFARAATSAGYWVYGKREYHSNIKGEHSYFVVRVSTQPIQSNTDPIHLLATFEATTAKFHAHEILQRGCLLFDPSSTDVTTLTLGADIQQIAFQYQDCLEQLAAHTGQRVAQLSIVKNTLAVAASLALFKIPLQGLETAVESLFSEKRHDLIAMNMQAASLAYEQVMSHQERFAYPLQPPAQPSPAPKSRLVVNGAIATAMGKVKSGCRVQTYYSITPAVDECIFLEEHPETGVLVFQCEDELAAINMAIGAATTGVRASTSTSGPGFSLMSEGLGWAGINEVPIVVFNYQRGGPSTGLPTRHEQSDLLFALHAGHGEFPRLVVAPGDIQESYEDAFAAFNWAEQYQTPVIVLSDKALANNTQSVVRPDKEPCTIHRGALLTPDLETIADPLAQFPRFALTSTGISPRPLPGTPGYIYWQTGDEHTVLGHVTEDPEIRIVMHEKRFRKLALASEQIPLERQLQQFGPDDADITLVSWGSTKGAILDAMPVLQDDYGIVVNFIQVRLLSPFPAEVFQSLAEKAKTLALLEMNMTAQLGQLIKQQTGIHIEHHILKWTGRPISQTEVISAVRDIAINQSPRIVLHTGL